MKKYYRSTSRWFIKKWDECYIMKRFRDWKDYYSLIGGWIDEWETPLEAFIREVDEEASLKVENVKFLWNIENTFNWKEYFHNLFFSTTESDFAPWDGPEYQRDDKNNTHQVILVKISDMKDLNFVPENAGIEKFIKDFVKQYWK